MANEPQKMREGNQMKMRVALDAILDVIKELRERNPKVVDSVRCAIGQIENWANYALSEPERNCDLPNPEERFTEFCSRYQSCSTCPHNRTLNGLRCDGKWLLSTAEKGGAE